MTRRSRFTIGAVILALLLPTIVFAQGTTGTLTGTVTQGGAALPGVTVTATSPNLQGSRTTVTNENGAYNFASLPPGDYSVKFELAGMQTTTRKVNVGLVETARVDADLKMAAVTEAITVTASAPAVMETTQVETNFKQATINRLPMNRNPVAQTALAPGVTGGINGNVISGGMSYDNLYLVNGAVVQENLRGQPHALYIEDAIQETTVLQGSISAEYGRFTGGVVSAITKSGGNNFSGSIRDTLDNPKWTAKSTSTQADPIDHINNTYEGTLGGRIVRDRLWFFAAGRKADGSSQRTLTAVATLPNPSLANYTRVDISHRYEGKLTGNLSSKHSLVVSYLNNKTSHTNDCQFGCLDFRTIDPSVSNPNWFKTAHYSGIITNNFLVEADYAKKYFAFVGFGGDAPRGLTSPADIAAATPLNDTVVTGAIFNAPYFCGSCAPELRNNHESEIKGRYFLGTKSLGTHNLVVGYDDWAEQRRSDNYQSPTDFRFDIRTNPPVQNPDGTVSIQVHGDPNGVGDRIIYFPIAVTSQGSNLKTDSAFFNDKWDLSQHFSFNLGVRFDRNNAVDSFGNKVSHDQAFSPRLGAIFDVYGNGRLRLDANYNKYVGRLAETVAGGASPAGNPASISFAYAGPDLPLMDSILATTKVFEWFLANGGTTRTPVSQSIPGFNTKLQSDNMKSPGMREYTLGAGTQIGKGYFRADYINRDWDNFYATYRNLSIGTVINPANGAPADLALIGNSDVPNRKYWGLQFQGQYQLPANFSVGGNYTYSKLRGNLEGESSGSGPITFAGLNVSYPQYNNFTQNAPTGYLFADQRHKLRVWGDWGIGTPVGRFSVGLIERYDSGAPYSASAATPITAAMLCSNGATNAACTNGPAGTVGNPIYPNGDPRNPAKDYANRPPTVTYFFSGRGAFRTQALVATDVAVNYELPIKSVALFAKGEVRNAFNKLAVINQNRVDTTVFTAQNAGRGLVAFNPFTQTPIECPQGAPASQCAAMGANWQKGPNFGLSTGTPTTFSQTGAYQLPRTYLISAGVRF